MVTQYFSNRKHTPRRLDLGYCAHSCLVEALRLLTIVPAVACRLVVPRGPRNTLEKPKVQMRGVYLAVFTPWLALALPGSLLLPGCSGLGEMSAGEDNVNIASLPHKLTVLPFANDTSDPDAMPLQKICQNLGVDDVITGRVTSYGKFYTLIYTDTQAGLKVSLHHCRTGEIFRAPGNWWGTTDSTALRIEGPVQPLPILQAPTDTRADQG